jgi:hypothetical protein
MDSYISTIIFTLPGLLCYFWISMLGNSPSQKHNPFEMLGISALLWIPVSILTLCYFNFISLIETLYLKSSPWDLHKVLPFINDLDDIKVSLNNLWFILFFVLSSLVFSYLIARVWTVHIHGKFLEHVNKVREDELKLSPYSKKQTVWEELFIQSGPKVIKISKLDSEDKSIIGSVRKASRPLETERNLALDEVDYFTQLVEKYNPIVMKVFIDLKAGVVISLYNPNSIEECQMSDNTSENPIIIPWSSD